MKKILFILTFFMVSGVRAQIINPGFEIQNGMGQPSYWKQVFQLAIPLDSNCNQSIDTVCFATADAHSGNFAYEMRVIDFCGNIIAGNIMNSRTVVDSGFGSQQVPFNVSPEEFKFFYKMLPVKGDAGIMKVWLSDSNGVDLAFGNIKLNQKVDNWTSVNVPLTYSSIDQPHFVSIIFYISNDSAAHPGSRFLVDDISYSGSVGIKHLNTEKKLIKCFPNPARDILNVENISTVKWSDNLSIFDISGRLVCSKSLQESENIAQVDISSLASGIYYIKLLPETGFPILWFIK